MQNKDFFTVKVNGQDQSIRAKEFTGPSVPMALTAGQSLHIGYYKPFRQFYIDFTTLNQAAANLAIEYFNGQAWVDIPNIVDETESFDKSGFMYFERPEDWAKTLIDGDELYYIRITPDADLSAETELNGINVLFSNDADLIGIRSNIVSKHNNGTPWIEKHEAARKYIVQQLRNLGHRKIVTRENNPFYYDESDKDVKVYSNLTQFDLLEPFELREASKFYALKFIYLDELSDEEDDKWERAGIRHERAADEAMNVFMLKIDTDDDGTEDLSENEGDTGTNLSWE